MGSGETHSLLACLLRNGTAPPTVTPSRDAPARAINTSTEYSLVARSSLCIRLIFRDSQRLQRYRRRLDSLGAYPLESNP